MLISKINVFEKIICPDLTFFCEEDHICISRLDVCDGINDCFSGEDEENCTIIERFHCETASQSIAAQNICDFVIHCENGMDEKFCSK